MQLITRFPLQLLAKAIAIVCGVSTAIGARRWFLQTIIFFTINSINNKHKKLRFAKSFPLPFS
ncbi:MAG TPA: hypothetical protein PK511_14310 [Chitinophagales bacterium]|nr:hypothetical protein [Chitinophagales bacterium]HMX04970.1 hypothetical protein [Chitinophagales bacterium]HMZ90459.1 hypothetical protein [Chitinophagales bacterium]HNA58335.1 hypothetical protein [Chitinophagales bacterium]HNE47388.1 hypothetical protein [Chitinophagales bacterium]